MNPCKCLLSTSGVDSKIITSNTETLQNLYRHANRRGTVDDDDANILTLVDR